MLKPERKLHNLSWQGRYQANSLLFKASQKKGEFNKQQQGFRLSYISNQTEPSYMCNIIKI